MRILVTSGATREPIDDVRFITNISTGATGAFLADYLAEQGHEISFFGGEGSKTPRSARTVETYTSFSDLDSKLRAALSNKRFDGIIHLAAISDYSVAHVETAHGSFTPAELKKIDSDSDITLRLKRNFKIVSRLKPYALPANPLVIAFKLTNSSSYTEQIAAINKLASGGGVDFVVHNDLHDIRANKDNRYRIFEAGKIVFESLDRQMLAAELEQLIRSRS
ncbi:MAG TPA: phosphopantothenoylcysteine decarboxylase [Bdellovibrionales bacterium]|nr:phosphopantothenoylcysteine decarboxylase [Bdellovibrionales bacterium]